MRPFIALVLAAGVVTVAVSRPAHALDCPCSWEEVVCRADAIAEVEMTLATKSSPDHATVRRVIWNGTKHRVRMPYGFSYYPRITPTRAEIAPAVREEPRYRAEGSPEASYVPVYREALRTGRYRTVLFLYRGGLDSWSENGLVINGVEWLSHPLHAEWWARLQPLLAERIRLYGQDQKPAACNVTRDTTRFAKFDLYGYESAMELTGDKRVLH